MILYLKHYCWVKHWLIDWDVPLWYIVALVLSFVCDAARAVIWEWTQCVYIQARLRRQWFETEHQCRSHDRCCIVVLRVDATYAIARLAKSRNKTTRVTQDVLLFRLQHLQLLMLCSLVTACVTIQFRYFVFWRISEKNSTQFVVYSMVYKCHSLYNTVNTWRCVWYELFQYGVCGSVVNVKSFADESNSHLSPADAKKSFLANVSLILLLLSHFSVICVS